MKQVNIMPRRSGKTTKAIQCFENAMDRDPIVICFNQNMADYTMRNVKFRVKNEIDKKQFVTCNFDLRSRRFKDVIIDEYFIMPLDRRKHIWEWAQVACPENITVFGTLPYKYDDDILKFVTEIKKLGLGVGHLIIDEFCVDYEMKYNEPQTSALNLIKDLYYNFITDADANIKNTYKKFKF